MVPPLGRPAYSSNRGSTEILVLGLLATLIVVLAIPYISDLGGATESNLGELLTAMDDDTISLESAGGPEDGGLHQ